MGSELSVPCVRIAEVPSKEALCQLHATVVGNQGKNSFVFRRLSKICES